MTLAATGPGALWYLTRSTGAVSLVLLTVTIVLGIANASRAQTQGWPRFVVEGVHRNASLLAIVMLAVHIATTVLDPFASISLVNAIVPFTGSYRPIWLGLGALASDLLLALALTSIVRRRLGQRTWRATHWLAYLCWPVAVMHGLGTGSDARTWLTALTAACVVVVVLAIWARASYSWRGNPAVWAGSVAASIALPVLGAIWAASGPLAPGWAARAGTPIALLAHTTHRAGTRGSRPATTLTLPFSTHVHGTISETETSTGLEVNVVLNTPISSLAAVDVRIYGAPLADGGVAMSSSAVSAGSAGEPERFNGIVTGLAGNEIRARVRNASVGVIDLDLTIAANQQTGVTAGTLTARQGSQ